MKKTKLPRRSWLTLILLFLLIPAALIFCPRLGGQVWYFTSLLIIALTLCAFFLVFEARRPQARELVVLAVLSALAVASRAAFAAIPHFKPMTAIIMITGIAFGPEAGFLTGAVSGFVSNFLFGQGPWTPWQMFAMGIIGWLAGILYRKGVLRRSKLSLCIFGVIASTVIFGGIMNPASALMWSNTVNWKIIMSYYVTGIPVDLVRAVATFVFLWLGAEPMLEKLDRVKTKYGLVE